MPSSFVPVRNPRLQSRIAERIVEINERSTSIGILRRRLLIANKQDTNFGNPYNILTGEWRRFEAALNTPITPAYSPKTLYKTVETAFAGPSMG